MEMRPYFVLLLPPYFSKLKCRRLKYRDAGKSTKPSSILERGRRLERFWQRRARCIALFLNNIFVERGDGGQELTFLLRRHLELIECLRQVFCQGREFPVCNTHVLVGRLHVQTRIFARPAG